MPSLPAVHYSDLRELMPLALACFMLGAVETAAIGRMFAEKHGYRLDSNQELLAIAGATVPPETKLEGIDLFPIWRGLEPQVEGGVV